MAKNLIDDVTLEFVEGLEASDLDSLEDRVDDVETDITSLSGRVTTAEGNITSVSGRVTTLEGKVRNITISSSDPSGGSNGDIWIKYV